MECHDAFGATAPTSDRWFILRESASSLWRVKTVHTTRAEHAWAHRERIDAMAGAAAVAFQRVVDRLLASDPLDFEQAARSVFELDGSIELREGDNISKMSDLHWIVIRDESVSPDARNVRLDLSGVEINASQKVVLISARRCILCNARDADGNLDILLTRCVTDSVETMVESRVRTACMILRCTSAQRGV